VVSDIKREIKFVVTTIGIIATSLAIGILSNDKGVLANSIILSTLVGLGTYFFYQYQSFRYIREIEESFPNFLRDLTDAINSGLPLYRAIQQTSNINYGSLTQEIKKMSNQISWGIPIDKVLDQFAERMRRSKRVNMATKIVKESYMSGGDLISTLTSLADDLTLLQDADKEKKSVLHQHMLIIYAITFIFIVIVVLINRLLMPIFASPELAQIGLANPCEVGCIGGECALCDLYYMTANLLFGIQPGIAAYYSSLFFYMSFVQAFFAGFVAGQISENSMIAGFKHSIILSVIVLVSFMFLSRMGLLGI